MRSIRSTFVAISFVALALAGCGGGGGGGSGGGGPNVAADFSLSASTMSFTAVQNGGAPPSQTITVSATGGTFGTDGTVSLSTDVGGAAVHSATISNCSGSTCSLVVVARGDAPPGTYSSQVIVRGCTNFGCAQNAGTPKTLTVTLTVGVGSTLTSPSVVTIFAAPNTKPVAQLLLVQSTDAAARWAASIAYEAGPPGWLAPIPNGTGSQQAVLQVSAMPLGTYRARITFHPTSGGIDTSTIVALSVREPRVTFVTPYIAVANQAGRVTIRGSGGFNALGAPQVMFGATPGTNVVLASDTEIRVDAPALPVGRYPVAVSAGGGTPPMAGTAELVVVAAPAYAYDAITRTGGASGLRPNQIVYDAERQKIFLYDPDSPILPGSPIPPLSPGAPGQRIERYRFNNGDWTLDDPLGFPLSGGDAPYPTSTIALTPDGRELLRTAQRTVTHFDPAQIAPADSLPLATVNASTLLGADIKLMGAAMANDGSFVGPAQRLPAVESVAYRYDVLERTFYLLAMPPSLTNAGFGTGLPTPTGRAVAIVGAGAGLPPARFDYSASTGSLDEVPNGAMYLPRIWSLSRDESIFVWAYDPSNGNWLFVRMPHWQVPGAQISVTLNYDVGAAALAPNGTRLYYYANDDGMVHTLDLEHPQNGVADVFPELASALVPDPPGAGPQMLITPDGGSLIIAGKDRVIVMPAP